MTHSVCHSFTEMDTCSLAMDLGSPCPGHKPANQMWYYHNPETGVCETMMYNGCGGNANRFLSYYDCATQCQSNFAQSDFLGLCEIKSSREKGPFSRNVERNKSRDGIC